MPTSASAVVTIPIVGGTRTLLPFVEPRPTILWLLLPFAACESTSTAAFSSVLIAAQSILKSHRSRNRKRHAEPMTTPAYSVSKQPAPCRPITPFLLSESLDEPAAAVVVSNALPGSSNASTHVDSRQFTRTHANFCLCLSDCCRSLKHHRALKLSLQCALCVCPHRI